MVRPRGAAVSVLVLVLVLVLSSHVPPYDALHEGQRATWDSLAVDGVETSYYFCETWDTYGPYRAALGAALARPWRHLFRTNSSSYVDKRLLLEFSDRMSAERCYCGGVGHCRGVRYASGSGALLSRDAVFAVRAALDGPIDLPGDCEDVFMGRAAAAAGIQVTPTADRFDYFAGDHSALPDVYHYRCKGVRPDGSRMDLEAFADIHRMKAARAPRGAQNKFSSPPCDATIKGEERT